MGIWVTHCYSSDGPGYRISVLEPSKLWPWPSKPSMPLVERLVTISMVPKVSMQIHLDKFGSRKKCRGFIADEQICFGRAINLLLHHWITGCIMMAVVWKVVHVWEFGSVLLILWNNLGNQKTQHNLLSTKKTWKILEKLWCTASEIVQHFKHKRLKWGRQHW